MGMGGDCSWLRVAAMGHELVLSSRAGCLRALIDACTHVPTQTETEVVMSDVDRGRERDRQRERGRGSETAVSLRAATGRVIFSTCSNASMWYGSWLLTLQREKGKGGAREGVR